LENTVPLTAQQLRQPGEKIEGQTFVVRKKLQTVHVPATLEHAKGNHTYGMAIDEDGNKVMAYIPAPFDPAENQHPKMLYHPDYGKNPEPTINQFAKGASSPEQYQNALDLFNGAHAVWEKGNRTKIAESPAREADLKKIGWMDYKNLAHLSYTEQKKDSDNL
jgi:hypothetical protein